MKVISGKLKGRVIKGFDIDGTRPTMDRVKESIFSMIQNYIKNSIALDLFAGSGNLGIEAISNGAKQCYFNDLNKTCVKRIKENLEKFNISEASIVTNMEYNKCLKYLKELDVKLDLVFLDPPYKLEVLNEIIELLLQYDILNNNCLIICEVGRDYLNPHDKLLELKNKKYGDKTVIIYKHKK